MTDLSHQVIRGYELTELIGAGGFGAVYRAFQAVVGREVAIKIILPQYANHPDFILRFEAEAQLVARLEHIHIVPLYDYWRDPQGAYLVMRWLHGGSLRGVLRREGTLSPQKTAHMLDQVASALAAAHRKGVIHRDLKPDNILLDEDGNAYLADFGIAKDVGGSVPVIDEGESIVGSPSYLSPEQITGQQVTPRTDIYSLGVMLYELLTGETPFPRLSPVELIQKHLREPLPSVLVRRPHLPTGIDAVIQKATAKSPGQRFQDAPSVALAFRRAVDGVPGGVGVAQADKGAPAQPSATTRQVGQTALNEPTLTPDTEGATITPGEMPAVYDSEGRTITPQAGPEIYDAESATFTPVTGIPATQENQATFAGVPTEELENPYKGLRAFQQADAADFFGRDALIQQLVSRLGEEGGRFLAVVGPSGSGKSSVVRAGVLPALRKGLLPGSGRWFLVEMIPGARPLEQLEEALLRVAVHPLENLREQLAQDTRGLLRAVNSLLPADSSSEVVLVIDQFEEVFTLLEDEAERAHLLESLLTAAADPASHLHLIVTLRADFYDRPLLYPEFGDLIRRRTEVVLPLTANELRRAIAGPAERVGVQLEPGLVEAIVSDVGEQPGALPLLQYALTELFERRQGRTLTVAAYRNSGGVLGALARRADELYESLDTKGREAARQVFLRLVAIGEGTEATRRRVNVAELASVGGDRSVMDAVIDAFSKYRLLTFDRDPQTRAPTLEVAHEALIRTWDRLRNWVAESREDLQMHSRLVITVSEWLASERDPSFLASGARLDQFESWAAETTLALNQDERAYLEASIAERNARLAAEEARKAHEALLERRSRNRLRVLVVVLFVATLGALGLTALAVNQQQIAVANAVTATIAQGQAVNNAATSQSNANTATVAQGQAVQNAATATIAQGQAVNNAATAISNANTATVAQGQAVNNAVTATIAQGQAINNAATSQSNFIRAESQRLAAEAVNVMQGVDGNAELAGLLSVRAIKATYSPQADQALMRATTLNYARYIFQHGSQITAVAFSPDGRYVLTTGYSDVVRLWDALTGKEVRQFRVPVLEEASIIWTAAFSPDGRYILTSSGGGQLRLWDIQTGQEAQRLAGQKGEVNNLTFSANGQYLLTAVGNTATLWDVRGAVDLRHFTGHTDDVRSVALSSDGKYAVTSSDDRTARLWDVATGEQRAIFTDPTTAISAVAISPDSRYVLTGGTASILWDVQTGQKVREFQGAASAVAFSPDGKLALVSGSIKAAQVWDVETGKQLQQLTGHAALIQHVAFSADGRYALTGSLDGTARLWSIQRTAANPRLLMGHTRGIAGLAFSPDGRYILTASGDRTARLWDASTGEAIRTFTGHTDGIQAAAYSPDGKVFLTGSTDKTLRLWDAATGQEIRQFTGHSDEIRSVAFSPDGRYVLSGSLDKTVRIWDAQSGQEIRKFDDNAEVLAVAFSRDGKGVLVGDITNTARLLNAETGAVLQKYEGGSGDQGFIIAVAFSPDGKTVLTGSYDRTARLFDAQSGKELRRFAGHSDGVTRVAFSPDGRSIVTGSLDTTARLWDVETGKELRRFVGHTDQLLGVAFSPDGKTVLTTSSDQTARIWDTNYQDSLAFICSHLLRDLTDEERAQYEIEDTTPTCPQFGSQQAQALPTWTPIPPAAGVVQLSVAAPPRQLMGHTDGVWSLAFSPDGKHLLSGSADSTARLWDIPTGKEIRQFKGHTALIYSVAFSPDGKYILTASDDKTARLWDAQTGQEIRKLSKNGVTIASAAFSPDGKYALTGSYDGLAQLWDVQTGQEVRPFAGHIETVRSVAFSPDGKTVLTGSYDQTARLWDTESGKELRVFIGHTSEILSVAFSPDGKTVLTGGGAARSATGGGDTTVRLWDVQSGEVVRKFIGHTAQVNAVAFSPDGKYILTGANDSTMRVWDVQKGIEVHRFPAGLELSDFVLSLAFSPDGRSIASGAFSDKAAQLWTVGPAEIRQTGLLPLTPTPTPALVAAAVTLRPRTFTGHTKFVYQVKFSPDSRYIASAGADATARFWDTRTGEQLRQLPGVSVAFAPDGKTWLVGGNNAQIRDVQSGAGLRAYSGHDVLVSAAAFSSDGQYLLTGGSDGSVRLWDLAANKEIRQFVGHSNRIWSVVFSPDGSYALTNSLDDSVRLWEITTGKELDRVTGVGGLGAAFSPDGTLVAIGGASPRLVRLRGESEATQLVGHQGAVADVTFSPDGKYVLTCGEDKTARLWDVQTGKELRRFIGDDVIWTAAFSPDGKFVLTGSNDGKVQLWDATANAVNTTPAPTLTPTVIP